MYIIINNIFWEVSEDFNGKLPKEDYIEDEDFQTLKEEYEINEDRKMVSGNSGNPNITYYISEYLNEKYGESVESYHFNVMEG